MFRKYASADDVRPMDEPRLTGTAIPSSACCCPARPVVRVIMPPAADRAHSVDLWLCGHHYRESFPALLASGAIIENLTSTADSARVDCAATTA